MRPTCYLSALCFSVPALLAAEVSEQEAYRCLQEGLRAEVQLLAGVLDAASAQAAVEPLSRVISELAALNSRVDERELWRYIDNTPNLKQALIEDTENLFVQLQRLEKAQCFHCSALQDLLAPMLSPAS